MFAVIKTGGKQYVVKEGDVLQVEKLGVEAGQKIFFDKVLLIEDANDTLIGMPLLDNAAVKAEVLKNFKDDKILVFKKKRRKQFRRTRGHRQPLTEVKIEKIYADKTAVSPEEIKAEAVKKEAVPVPEKKMPPKEKPEAKVVKKEEKKVPRAPAKKIAKRVAKQKPEKARKPKAPAKTKAVERPKSKPKKAAK
jgi:large subunit ribosomal protein L21